MAAITPLAAKLPALSAQLTAALLSSLSMPSNKKSSVTMLISLLLRLNSGAAAKITFLKMRSQVIKNLIRKIRFEGHIGAYIGDLAIVVFTAIKHTADWFLASFKENEAASSTLKLFCVNLSILTFPSAFIEWAKLQIENYSDIFRKQVYSSDVDAKVVEEAMKITYAQSRKANTFILLQQFINLHCLSFSRSTALTSVSYSMNCSSKAQSTLSPVLLLLASLCKIFN